MVRVRVFLWTATLLLSLLAVFWTRALLRPSNSVEILDFRMQAYGENPEHRGHEWLGGSPYVLRFALRQNACPVVVHVDDVGNPSLLFPDRDALPVAGGELVHLPPLGSGQAWMLGDEPGRQWFFLAARPDLNLDPTALLDELEREGRKAHGKAAEVAREVERILRKRVGETRRFEIVIVGSDAEA